MRIGSALAGVPTRQDMAGGERYVQRETLKSFGLSRGRCSTPGYPSDTDDGNHPEIGSVSAGLEQPVPNRENQNEL